MFGAGAYVEDINIIRDYAFNNAKIGNTDFFFETPPNDNLDHPIFEIVQRSATLSNKNLKENVDPVFETDIHYAMEYAVYGWMKWTDPNNQK